MKRIADGIAARKAVLERVQREYDFSGNVVKAFLSVPRDRFVMKGNESMALHDTPLPLSHGQTISAMHMVLMMLSKQLGDPHIGDAVLDIGTGSGYAAAVAAEAVQAGIEGNPMLVSIEVIPELAKFGYGNLLSYFQRERVKVISADAVEYFQGKHELFDLIQVAAAPVRIPKVFVDLLRPGGRLVIPIGRYGRQQLIKVQKNEDGSTSVRRDVLVSFVPLQHSPCEFFEI